MQILWKANCRKGTSLRIGACLPSGEMGRGGEERRNRANRLRNGPVPKEV